jgi:hypothetical protein
MVGKNALFGNQAEKNKLPKGVTGMKLSRTDRFFQGIGPVDFITEVSERPAGMPKKDPATAWDGTLFDFPVHST